MARKRELGELWTCPACGRKFVARNMQHACSDASVADFLRRARPAERALYEGFEALIAACGPYHVSPAKTRIAFMARVRFAGVTAIGPRGLRVAFALPAPLDSARLLDVKEVVPGWWMHRLQVTRPEELDRELLSWLRESYRLMGMQERLVRGVRESSGTTGTKRAARAPRKARARAGRATRR